jgi:RecB family endonuclease NucS
MQELQDLALADDLGDLYLTGSDSLDEDEVHWSQGVDVERYLEDELEAKIRTAIESRSRVFDRNLVFAQPSWRQVRTEDGSGIIDLLVKDIDEDCYIILELKRDEITSDAIKQITRYMDWAKEKCSPRRIRGILCGYSIPAKTRQVLTTISELSK